MIIIRKWKIEKGKEKKEKYDGRSETNSSYDIMFVQDIRDEFESK